MHKSFVLVDAAETVLGLFGFDRTVYRDSKAPVTRMGVFSDMAIPVM